MKISLPSATEISKQLCKDNPKVSLPSAAEIFKQFCKDNPKANWHIDDLKALKLKWTSRKISAALALNLLATAIIRFESKIIPKINLKLPGIFSSKINKINHKRTLTIALLKCNLSTPSDIIKTYKNEKDFLERVLPCTSVPFVDMDPILKKVYERAKSYKSETSKSKEAAAEPTSWPAATLFAEFKKDNPKVDWNKAVFDKKHLKWSHSFLRAEEAIKAVYEAIVRFEANLIPSAIKNKRPISIAFLNSGISSSLDIVDQYTPETFAKAFGELFRSLGTEWVVEQTYNNALEMRSRILLHYLNIHSATQQHYRVTPWSVSKNTVENGIHTLPNYHGLFGDEVYREIDHNNSVLSPTAYLYELKKTVNRCISVDDPEQAFDKRRPDIGELELTPDNTSREVIKLEIVNRVLETTLKPYFKKPVYETLSSSYAHMTQPFFLPAEEVKGYLNLLGSSLGQVWSSCSAIPQEEGRPVSADSVLDQPLYAKTDLPKTFGLLQKNFKGEVPVATLESVLKLDYQQMDEVIAGDLSPEEIQQGRLVELFVNADEKQEPIHVSGGEKQEEQIANLTDARLSKIIKLARLSKSYPVTIAELQWILTNVARLEHIATTDPQFFVRALPYLDTVSELLVKYSLTADHAIGLIGYAKRSTALATDFPGLLHQSWNTEGEDDKSKQIRYALIRAVGVNDPGFGIILSTVLDQFATQGSSSLKGTTLALDEEVLSAFWRVRQLIAITGSSYLDLMILFKITTTYSLVGPIGTTAKKSDSLNALSRLLQAHEWITANNLSLITLDYLYCGEFDRYFGVYSETTAEPLITQIDEELGQEGLDVGQLDSVIASVLEEVATPQSSPRFELSGEQLSGAAIQTLCEQQRYVSTQGVPGVILQLPSQAEVKDALQSLEIEVVVESPDEQEPLLDRLAQLLSELLSQIHSRQSEIFFSAVENSLKIDPSYSTDFSRWGSYVLEGSDPLSMIAEKEDLTRIVGYLNAIVRFKTLIKELGLTAEDVTELLNRPSFYSEDPSDELNPRLTLDNLQELRLMTELKQKCGASCAQLYQFVEQGDVDDLADRLGAQSEEIKTLLTLSKADKGTQGFYWISKVLQLVELQAQTGLTAKQLQGIASLASTLKYNKWQKWTSELEHTVQAKYRHADWQTVVEPLQVALQEKKRDVLVDEVLHQFGGDAKWSHVQTRAHLAAHLLIDLDVSALVTTSYVKEAITALQLYIHRCEMHIEEGVEIDSEFNILWKWMRNYSIWAANRLVFLYPENYLEPELRKGRTPLFDQFSGFLKRNKVSSEQINNAYNNYLDGFLSIANLEIVNAWVYDKSHHQNNELILIGRTTESDGYKYFYRIATFKENERLDADVPDDWSVWKEVETKIPTKWITPISAFGRIYVFWVEIQQYDGDEENKKNTGLATIKCCFYNFRGKWSVPQTLAERIHVDVNPRTATAKEQQSLHALDISKSNSLIQIVYHFEKNKTKTVLSLDPHMRVTQEESSSFKASFTFSTTNSKSGFIDGSPAYALKNTKGQVNRYAPKEQMTIGGWFYLDNTDRCTLMQLASKNRLPSIAKLHFGDALMTGIGLQVIKGQLMLTNLPSQSKFKIPMQICNTQHQLKAKSWYYIALQVDTSNEKGFLKYSVPKLIVMEASYSKKRIMGKVFHLSSRQFVAPYQNVFAATETMKKGNKKVVNSIKFKLDLLFNDSSITCLAGSQGRIKDVAVFDSLVPMDRMIQLSGATTGQTPDVHIASDAFLCGYIPNSDRRMILMQNKEASYLVVNDNRMDKQYFYRLTSSVAAAFDAIYSSNVDGISALLSSSTQQTKESPFAELGPDPKKVPKEFWPQDQFIDLNGSDEIYYWELFFHVPLLLAKTFNASQNYEQAKKWYEYIFNPLVGGSEDDEGQEDPNDAYWSFIGLKTHNNPTLRYEHFGDEVFEGIDELSNDASTKPKWDTHLPAIKKYHEDPFDPHAIAKLRPIAYQRSVFKHYIDNIMDWGDHLYRQNTRETLAEAYMLYAVVMDLLGPKPFNAGLAPSPQPQKLNQLLSQIHGLSDFLVGLENSLTHTGPINCSPIANPHNEVTGSYFGIPENEQFVEIWTRVESRLYNLRHQLTLEGQPNRLPLFQPPANPLALIAAAASGGAAGQGYSPTQVSVPAYRFLTIFPKAMEFVTYLTRFGTQLQTLMRTRDTTVIQAMKREHQTEILKQLEDIKKGSIKIAQSQVESAKLSLARAEYKRDYFDTLLNEGVGKKSSEVNRYKAAIAMKDTGIILRELSAILFALSSDLSFVKMLTAPFSGLVFGLSAGGANVAGVPEGASKAGVMLGFAYQTQAGVLASIASELDQAQNNYFKKKTAQQAVEETKKRIEMTESRLEMAKKNYDIYKTQLRHQQQIEDYYQQTFLDEELYLWMIQSMTMLYKQAYSIAHEQMLDCQKAWQYEIGDNTQQFMTSCYWDDAHRGFLAGEKMSADLLRMEKEYYQRNTRSLEIVKEVSLAEADPLAFVALVQTGTCHFSLDQALYDGDYPGHYKRRIKSVSLSLITNNKPNNINATLTQLSNMVAMEPDIDIVSFLHKGKTTKGAEALDPTLENKIWKDYCNHQQIATSTASDDSGLFSLSFDYDKRYLPFEGTGAVSEWLLEIGMRENAAICKPIEQALYINYFLSKLDVEALVSFVRGVQGSPTLANSFHEEVMEVLTKKWEPEAMAEFIQQAIDDRDLFSDWFQNLGKTNLESLVSLLTGQGDKATSARLTAYIASCQGLPDAAREGKASTTDVLDIGDIVIKVSYTALNGSMEFKDNVRTL